MPRCPFPKYGGVEREIVVQASCLHLTLTPNPFPI